MEGFLYFLGLITGILLGGLFVHPVWHGFITQLFIVNPPKKTLWDCRRSGIAYLHLENH